MQWLRFKFRHQGVILISLVFALIVFNVPLQHFITLARWQHYALCLVPVSVGYLLQLAISWRRLRFWGRTCLTLSAVYLAAFAIVIYTNPWLDPGSQLETTYQSSLQRAFGLGFLAFGLILTIALLAWNREEKERRDT